MTRISRRSFLTVSGLLPFAAPLEALAQRVSAGLPIRSSPDYGPLRPVVDATTGAPLLELPEGFRYLTFGWAYDVMSNDAPTPANHDGMAAFAGVDGTVTLVRNHELSPGTAFGVNPYDAYAGGGTTTLTFDPRAERVTKVVPSLSGTLRNCAGGRTQWNSWLSCEETVLGPTKDNLLQRQHGYIFDVPSDGVASGEPLKAMGCFVHEATATDPETGIVYETEDQGTAGLYRFVPNDRTNLRLGGKLQMLAVNGRPRYSTRDRQRTGERFSIHWVDIPEPDRPHADESVMDGRGVQQQGLDRGAAIFARLEGAWFGDDKLYVTATSGGDAQMGQVWELDPREQTLRMLFESPAPDVLNMPDNLCVSPRGGLVVCEDGTVRPCVHGLTRDGRLFRFARNNVVLTGERNGFAGDFTGSEFAGATYSPDGKWLFLNVQRPGITFAITGPWEEGAL